MVARCRDRTRRGAEFAARCNRQIKKDISVLKSSEIRCRAIPNSSSVKGYRSWKGLKSKASLSPNVISEAIFRKLEVKQVVLVDSKCSNKTYA